MRYVTFALLLPLVAAISWLISHALLRGNLVSALLAAIALGLAFSVYRVVLLDP